MVIVTGAAGFIGSCMVRKLNDEGLFDLLLVDDFSNPGKNRNLEDKQFREKIHRYEFPAWLEKNAGLVSFIFHLGARTDTTEQDTAIFDRLNLEYSKHIWNTCAAHGIPLLYASSAATYGSGELGYDDRHDIVPALKPLNPYGRSKNDFDRWVLQQTTNNEQPKTSNEQRTTNNFWAGLKFFNVYGPNEYHKGRMASVIFHTVKQIRQTGEMKLFRSHRPGISHGHQKRDFIYVKDVVDVCWFFYQNQPHSGLYNVGTGRARAFLDLATSTFRAMDLEPHINFIDTPEDIRATYQYFTEANMEKLRGAGYDKPFYSLEAGVEDYVKGYLMAGSYW
ncbi:MAG: ADP-glyceromanno-heptose 6-epimerase [Saprospiraceae bacterium]